MKVSKDKESRDVERKTGGTKQDFIINGVVTHVQSDASLPLWFELMWVS